MFKLSNISRKSVTVHYPAFILLLICCCIIIINPIIMTILDKLWLQFVVSICVILILFSISLLASEQLYSLFNDTTKGNITSYGQTNYEITSPTPKNYDFDNIDNIK